MEQANMHIHSRYSWDCKTNLEDIAKTLIDSGIKYAGISDHVEYDRESLAYVLTKFKIRNEEIDKLNDKYKGKITLLKGAEISSPQLYKDKVDALAEVNLDFLMGSIHDIDKNARTDFEKSEATYRYYKKILEMVKANQVDIVGHIDYINRYYESDYSNSHQLSEIFYHIKENNMIIEINASALRRIGKLQKTFPNIQKLKMYAKTNENVTIGTDAHRLEELTDNLKDTEYTAKILGLSPVIFKKRKMIKL